VSQTGSSPVNVGSNTITVRAVNGYRLLRRQVLPTLGSFRSPWRPHGDVVCVLNTRDGGSIQGYRRIGSLLAPIPPWHRALGLEPNATPEFLTPPGQVRDPERNVPRAIIAGVAGVAVLYLAGTLAVLGDGAAGAARRIGRPTMRGRSQ
jgi:hypothetical protein